MNLPDLSTAPRINAADVPVTNPHGVVSTYSNFVGIGTTQTDVRLVFTELGNAFEGGKAAAPSNVLKANVVIPLAQAENLSKLLLAVVQQHRAMMVSQAQAQTAHAQKAQKT